MSKMRKTRQLMIEKQMRRKTTNGTELSMIFNVEQAIGLDRKIGPNGDFTYVRVSTFVDDEDSGSLEHELYVYKRFYGTKRLGDYPAGWIRDLAKTSVIMRAERLLTKENEAGRTLFEGGINADSALKSLRVLVTRLRLMSLKEDPSEIYLAWRFTVLSHDFMSNERTAQTIRNHGRNR